MFQVTSFLGSLLSCSNVKGYFDLLILVVVVFCLPFLFGDVNEFTYELHCICINFLALSLLRSFPVKQVDCAGNSGLSGDWRVGYFSSRVSISGEC